MNSIPTELNGLIHYCQSLARLLLIEQGEFYPFGVYLNAENVITQRLFPDGDDFPLSTGLINIIKYDFDQQQNAGIIKGSAIAYAARITNTYYTEPVEVIVVRLNMPGLKPVLYYMPYRLADNEVEYLMNTSYINE